MTGDGQTRVGHCKRDETDVYIGRGSGDRNLLNTQIGSKGWLGNPYPADVFGREECIQKFRSVFEERLHDEPEFREAVRDLAGETLGCWCQSVDEDGPACHGEVIAEHADRLADQEVRTDGGEDVYRVRIWKGATAHDEHHEGEPDEVVEVEEETPHVWQDDPHYSSPPLGIDVHPDDCPATLNVYTSESVRSPPGYESHVEEGYWDGPMEQGLEQSADHDYPPFGCRVWGRVMFFVEPEGPEDVDEALTDGGKPSQRSAVDLLQPVLVDFSRRAYVLKAVGTVVSIVVLASVVSSGQAWGLTAVDASIFLTGVFLGLSAAAWHLNRLLWDRVSDVAGGENSVE